mgnify:CR=1 FL=1
MQNRTELISRIIGLILFAILGVYYGIQLSDLFNLVPIIASAVLGILGAVIGFLITPYVTIRPVRYLVNVLGKTSLNSLMAGLVGLVVGLLVAVLVAFPLSLLPDPFGQILPFIGVLFFGYLGMVIFIQRQNEIFGGIRPRWPLKSPSSEDKPADDLDTISSEGIDRKILLDTSVIIDGRIADISQTGFLVGTLLIPRFVLNELQYIADSPDALRRQRGRRGMEVLSQLQKDMTIPVRISDIDVEGVKEVDEKLVVLARQLRCPILTNDFNLNRVAELQGVTVLNVNELANAVKSVLLPGEIVNVSIIQEGREAGQGVAYLDDGTMVVVEDGRGQINTEATVTVTKVLQTAAGRMIFARLGEEVEK